MSKNLLDDDELLTFIGLTEATDLTALVHGLAEQKVKDYLGVEELVQQTFTEFYPLDERASLPAQETGQWEVTTTKAHAVTVGGSPIIQLRHTPVRSITSVYKDIAGYFGQVAGAFAESTLLTAGTDFYLPVEKSGLSRTGHLVRRYGEWPSQPGSVKVVYVAGYTAAELAGRYRFFKEAVLEAAGDLYSRGKAFAGGQRPGIAGEGLGGGVSAQYVNERLRGQPLPDHVCALLDGHLNYSDV